VTVVDWTAGAGTMTGVVVVRSVVVVTDCGAGPAQLTTKPALLMIAAPTRIRRCDVPNVIALSKLKACRSVWAECRCKLNSCRTEGFHRRRNFLPAVTNAAGYTHSLNSGETFPVRDRFFLGEPK
jgi:hypothetical protein